MAKKKRKVKKEVDFEPNYNLQGKNLGGGKRLKKRKKLSHGEKSSLYEKIRTVIQSILGEE